MKLRKLLVAVTAMVVMAAPFAQAANGTWTLNNAGNWSTTNNWLGGIVADGADFTATLGDVITADRTITLDSVRAIGGITVSDTSHNYTITSSKLTLDVTSGSPTLTVPSGRTLTINSLVDGSDGLTKTGAGTLTLTYNANQFTGSTVISDGKVVLVAQYALWKSPYDTTGSTGAIGLDVTGQVAPVLGGLAGNVDLMTGVTAYNAVTALTLNPQTGYTNTYSGVIANGSGAMTLTKTGDGAQTLTGVNSYSGATTIYDGTLGLGGAAGSALNSAFTVRGGTLSLDNSAGWANRIADATVITNGSLTLKSDNGGSPQTETVGPTTLATSGKITIDNGTGAGTTLAVNGAVTRNAGAAIDFVGLGGTLGSGAGNPNVTATTLPANANGILPWATVNGTQWAENNANSIRAYSSTFVDPTSAGTDATKNAQLTGSGTMGSAKSFNSLNVIASGAGQSMSLGGILTLTSPGAILKSGADAYSITSSVANAVTAGTELIAHVDGGDLTISAPLNTAIVGLAKGGTGKLVLSGTRAGTLSGAMSIVGNLEFQGAGTTLSGAISGPGGLVANLNSGQRLILSSGANTYSGPTLVKGGILQIGTAHGNQGGQIGGVPGSSMASAGQGLLSNIELNGGSLAVWYYMSEFLGSGPGQIQLTGGRSGISAYQTDMGSSTWTINSDASYEVVWGSAYFNPSVFVLQDSSITGNGGNVAGIPNKINLNGATRTVASDSNPFATPYSAGYHNGGRLGGVIRDSQNSGAGLIKTGIGHFELAGANTFNGPVTIEQGTLWITSVANGGVASALGMSSAAASNVLLANGSTLRYSGGAASSDRSFTIAGTADGHSATLNASGSGAIVLSNTSTPAYGTSDQTRTLILGGTSTFTNTLAATLADNGTGTLSVNKTGTGTWVLIGANTYTGTNVLTGGLLSMSATNNLGAPSTPVVFSGGGLQITGTAITSLSGIGHPITYTAGNSVTLDIPAANTFTVDQPLGGASFVKTGVGTLVFATNNAYIGQTTISGGVLQYNDGMVIPTTPLLNNGTLAVNRSDGLTQGVNFHAIMGGTGALNFTGSGSLTLNGINLYTGTTKASAGTITLSHPLAIQNSAVDTAGAAGAIVLSGITTPTIGGLTGTVAIATALTGYGSVTALNLNPQSGITYNYAGVIADGASGMALKMVGPGTQIFTGNNTYTGITYLNAGSLTVGSGSTIGKITGTTGLTFNGGTLQFNRSGTTDVDAFPNTAPVTVNSSSTFGATSADAGNANANETVGAVTLNAGQMNFNWSNGGSSGTQIILTSLARSGTASANFNSGFSAASSRWKVTGSGTTTTGEILGPWYTTGGNNAGFASTDYAVYSSDFVAQANITANNTETTWGSASNIHVNATATTLTATRTLNTLRYSAAAGSVALGSNNLETYGLLNGGSGLLTVSGTGALTTPTGGSNLYVNAGANSITVSAPINNNGGDVTLVKNGGNMLTLSGAKNYAGGTVLNAGSLTTTADNQLGTGGVTVNGTVTWNSGDIYNHARALTINEGAELTLNNGSGVTGVFSGNGRLRVTTADAFRFLNASNTFSGPIYANTANSTTYGLEMASIGDGVGAGLISLDNGNFRWMKASGGTTTLTNRQFALSGTTSGGTIQALGTTAAENLIINKDLLVTGVGNKTFRLAGSNTGNNWFVGNITDGPGSVISLTKEEGGTWIISGTNTYTGTTIVLAGKLILSNAWSVASGVLDVRSGAKVQLDYTGSRPVAEFWTNGVKAASGIIYNSVNATNYLFGSGSIMVGIETFKVTYNGNGNTGGAAPVDSNAYTNNQTVVVLGAGTLTKGVYSFGGWSKQDGPTYAPGSTFQITTNTTLYAIWRPAGTLIQFK